MGKYYQQFGNGEINIIPEDSEAATYWGLNFFDTPINALLLVHSDNTHLSESFLARISFLEIQDDEEAIVELMLLQLNLNRSSVEGAALLELVDYLRSLGRESTESLHISDSISLLATRFINSSELASLLEGLLLVISLRRTSDDTIVASEWLTRQLGMHRGTEEQAILEEHCLTILSRILDQHLGELCEINENSMHHLGPTMRPRAITSTESLGQLSKNAQAEPSIQTTPNPRPLSTGGSSGIETTSNP